MRVFDEYLYNAAQKVSFKDTKKYIDDMLSEMGLKYTNVGFRIIPLHNDEREIKAACNEFPVLSKYLRYGDDDPERGEPFFSSLSDFWDRGDIFVPEEDIEAVTDAFFRAKKFINSPRCYLMLAGIDWYGDLGDASPACGSKERYRNKKLDKNSGCPAQFSGIILRWDYSSDRKYNPVEVIVEATAENEPRDTTDIAKKLEKYLGSEYIPLRQKRTCMFPQDEALRYYELEKRFRKKIDELFEEMVGECRHSKSRFITLENGQTMMLPEEPEAIKGICDKRSLNKAFKPYGIQVAGTNAGVNKIQFTDKHGFHHDIGIFRKWSGHNEFGFYMSINSYNFMISLFQKDFEIDHISQSVDKLSKIAKYCAYLRDSLSDEIASEFGDSPQWYEPFKW